MAAESTAVRIKPRRFMGFGFIGAQNSVPGVIRHAFSADEMRVTIRVDGAVRYYRLKI